MTDSKQPWNMYKIEDGEVHYVIAATESDAVVVMVENAMWGYMAGSCF